MSVNVGPASGAWSDIWSVAQSAAADAAEFDNIASFLAVIPASDAAIVVTAGVVTIGLPEIAIGIFCVILLVAFITLIIRPLAVGLGGLPFVGDHIKDGINAFGDWLVQGEKDVFNWAFGGIISFITSVSNDVWSFGRGLVHGAEAVVSTVQWIMGNLVPYVWGNSLAHADTVAQNAENGAIAWSAGVFGNVYNELHNVEAQLPQVEQNAIAQAEAWAGGIFNGIYTEIHAVEGTVTQNFQHVEQQIGDLVESIPLQLGHAITTAEQFATQVATDAATGLENALGPAIAAAAAAAAAAGAGLQQYLDNCGKDMCAANGQNAKNVNNLATDIGAALLFGFVAACIKEPNPMANASYEILQPVIGLAGGAADALLGAAVA